ncbi:Uncharacterized protein HA466_0102400 [Hirschfeldia incana]|nr:Uncharacterized protein HA466_0102400 [Hirschfeldia incana]
MGEQIMERKFAWVLKKFSSLQDDEYYSRPFSVAGCNWRLVTSPKGEGDTDGYLSLYLQLADPESLPPGWSRQVNFTLTVLSKRLGKSNKVLGGGQCCFNTEDTSWGHSMFISLAKLHSKARGFLVKNKLTIVAELHVFPEDYVSIAAPLGSKDETQADEKADLVDNGASEEDSDDDDDGTSDWVTDNDASFEEDVENFDIPSPCLDDGGGDMRSPLDQSNALEDAETTEIFNEFDFSPSQVESVTHIFRRHPEIAIGFRPRNGQIRRAYMNELLSLIDMLCQSPEKLSEDDLSNADDTLADLIDVGFRLDWLKTKLNEVSEKKKKIQSSGARLQTMEEQLRKLKLMFLDLETQLLMEKAEALAARAPFSFNDVVY